MGKHRGKNDEGHGKDVVWQEKNSPKQKAENFDAYDNYLKGEAKKKGK